MAKAIAINIETCNSCGLCEQSCSFEKEREFNPSLSGIRIEKNEGREIYILIFCQQCEKAVCMKKCPTNALRKNSNTGVVEWFKADCLPGCDKCVAACPFGAIRFVRGKVIKCDQCNGNPACVQICPKGTLTFVDEKDWGKREKNALLRKYKGLLDSLKS